MCFRITRQNPISRKSQGWILNSGQDPKPLWASGWTSCYWVNFRSRSQHWISQKEDIRAYGAGFRSREALSMLRSEVIYFTSTSEDKNFQLKEERKNCQRLSRKSTPPDSFHSHLRVTLTDWYPSLARWKEPLASINLLPKSQATAVLAPRGQELNSHVCCVTGHWLCVRIFAECTHL